MKTHTNFLGDLLGAINRGCSSLEFMDILQRAIRYGQEHPEDEAYIQFVLFMKTVKDAHQAETAVKFPWAATRRNVSSPGVGLDLEGERGTIRGRWDPARCAFRFTGIQPARYRLLSDTGWLLWEQDLCAAHLQTEAAFPSRVIPLAADSSGLTAQPTGAWDLLDHTLQIRVYPGIEAGCVEAVLSGREVGHGAR